MSKPDLRPAIGYALYTLRTSLSGRRYLNAYWRRQRVERCRSLIAAIRILREAQK